MPKKPTRRELDAMMADLIKENYTNAPPLPDQFAHFGSHPKDPMILAIEQNEGIAELFMTMDIGEQTDSSLEDNLGRAYAHRHKADQLLEKRDFRQARTHYVEAATTLCGRIPYRAKFLCDKYLELKSATPSVVATLCCVGAARCMYELREYEEALQYVSQVSVLQRHAQFASGVNGFEWFDFDINIPDYYRVRLLATSVAHDIYTKLGNTAAAAESNWTGTTVWTSLSPTLSKQATKGLSKQSQYHSNRIHSQRHPDPALAHKSMIVAPNLQIRGSWWKTNARGLSSRMGCATFVHDGHLYAFGGEKGLDGPHFSDLWRLNLATLNEWQQLPSYPFANQLIREYTGYRMAVNVSDNRAYLFVGDLELHYFDLTKNEWGRMRTTFSGKGRWPYCIGAKGYVMHAIDGKLYVFGGTHAASPVGTDLLMVLDIERKEWKLLSGTRTAESANLLKPGPRENACSWVGKDGKKIYVMYGDADRLGAKYQEMPHGAMTTYDYDDLWCWDIEQSTWTKQRIVGNQPSKRTEMACVYNPILDKVLTFGGYSPRVPTYNAEDNQVFRFSYYADTFMLGSSDPSTSSWKHVLTRGFPIYRAQSQLIVDPASGKTYLFSGYTNSQYVPGQKHLISRSFSDVWQLKLDLEGGFFEGVNVDEEAKTVKAGPWQRCFSCGSAGLWRKCGGSCGGKVCFCDALCLKEGWKAHKNAHNCSKV